MSRRLEKWRLVIGHLQWSPSELWAELGPAVEIVMLVHQLRKTGHVQGQVKERSVPGPVKIVGRLPGYGGDDAPAFSILALDQIEDRPHSHPIVGFSRIGGGGHPPGH